MAIKETFGIKAEFDGKNAERGIKSIGSGLSDIAKTATGVASAFLGFKAVTGAISAVESAVSGLANTYKNMLDVAGQFQDLQFKTDVVLKNIGTSYDEQRQRLEALTNEMWNYAGVSKDTTTQIFNQMVLLSGNLEESFRAVPAILDLTATGLVNSDMAARGLSQTLEGQVGVLGRYVPEITTLSKEELKAGKAIDLLNKKYKGLAHAHTITLPGSIETLKDSFKSLAIALGSESTESIASMISGFAEEIRAFAQSEDAKEMSRLLGSIAQNVAKTAESLLGQGHGHDLASLINDTLRAIESYTGTKLTGDLRDLVATLKELYYVLKGLAVLLYPAKGIGMMAVQFGKEMEAVKREEEYWAAQRAKHGKAGGGILRSGEYAPAGNDDMRVPVKPGEFIMNAQATARFFPLLQAMNAAYRSGLGGSGFAFGGPYDFQEWYKNNDIAKTVQFGGQTLEEGELAALINLLTRKYGYAPGSIQPKAASYNYAMQILRGGNIPAMYLIATQQYHRQEMFPGIGFLSSDQNEKALWYEIARFAKKHLTKDEAAAHVMGFVVDALAGRGEHVSASKPTDPNAKQFYWALLREKPTTKEEIERLRRKYLGGSTATQSTTAGLALTTEEPMNLDAYRVATGKSAVTPKTITPTPKPTQRSSTFEAVPGTTRRRTSIPITTPLMLFLGFMSSAMEGFFGSSADALTTTQGWNPFAAFRGLNPGAWTGALPAMATGGTVPGRPGQPQMILAHGGEGVIAKETNDLLRQFIQQVGAHYIRPEGAPKSTGAAALHGGHTIIIATSDNQKAEVIKRWLKAGSNIDLDKMSAMQADRRFNQ